MLLFFLCLRTIPARNGQTSCQTTLSAPASSGSAATPSAPLQRPYDSPYAVVTRGLRAFTIRVGARDEIISVARLKPCTDAVAEPGLLRRRGQLPKAAVVGQIPAANRGDQPAPRRDTFSDPLVSTPSQRPQAPPRASQGTGFVLPRGEVFCPPCGGDACFHASTDTVPAATAGTASKIPALKSSPASSTRGGPLWRT